MRPTQGIFYGFAIELLSLSFATEFEFEFAIEFLHLKRYKITPFHRLIGLLFLAKMSSNHRTDDTRISNACHGLNFHHRDLKFSEIVPNTITIMNKK